jgi:hypothetical protein
MKILFGIIWLPIKIVFVLCGGRKVPLLKGLIDAIDSALR